MNSDHITMSKIPDYSESLENARRVLEEVNDYHNWEPEDEKK